MGIEELIAAEGAAAERNVDAPIKPGAQVSRGHQRTRTLQVRLNEDELAMLTALAVQRGVPVSTLAREVLLGQAAPAETPQAAIARIRSELEFLAASVA